MGEMEGRRDWKEIEAVVIQSFTEDAENTGLRIGRGDKVPADNPQDGMMVLVHPAGPAVSVMIVQDGEFHVAVLSKATLVDLMIALTAASELCDAMHDAVCPVHGVNHDLEDKSRMN